MEPSTRKRLFIGVNPEPKSINTLLSLQERVSKVLPAEVSRQIPEENLHLTLHFLGMTHIALIPGIEKAIQEKMRNREGCEVLLHTLLGFPNRQKASVLALAGSPGIGPLSSLYQLLADAIQPLGFKPERRIFIPHVTLFRFKSPIELSGSLEPSSLTFGVNNITLFESIPTTAGSQYSPITRFELVA